MASSFHLPRTLASSCDFSHEKRISCDDDDLPAMDGLFRPVISDGDNIIHGLDDDNYPYMIINWDNYSSANQYTIKIEANDGSDTREVSTDTTFYRFDRLQYD